MVLPACDQQVVVCKSPAATRRVLQLQRRAGEGVEAPGTLDDPGDGVGKRSRRSIRRRRYRSCYGRLSTGIRVQRQYPACGRVSENQAAMEGIRRERYI